MRPKTLSWISDLTLTCLKFDVPDTEFDVEREVMKVDRSCHVSILYLSVALINPLNPKLNPICYMLALLGAHHFLHVSRIRVKLLTFRLLMS